MDKRQVAGMVKLQTLECAIANALAADTVKPYQLPAPDKDFNYITGVWAKVVTPAGGNAYLNVGVRDSTYGEWIEPTPQDLLNTDTSVPANAKFTPLKIKNDGRTISAMVKNPALTTDALGKVVFVFRLEKLVEEA